MTHFYVKNVFQRKIINMFNECHNRYGTIIIMSIQGLRLDNGTSTTYF